MQLLAIIIFLFNFLEPVVKKQKKETIDAYKTLLKGDMNDGYKFVEKFNQDMMDQFMEYQKRHTSRYIKWERERYRQEQLALEQWRNESREHEKQMFGVFCTTISHCNNALNILLKEKQEAQDEVKRLKLILNEDVEEEEEDENEDDDDNDDENDEDDDSPDLDAGIPGIVCTDNNAITMSELLKATESD